VLSFGLGKTVATLLSASLPGEMFKLKKENGGFGVKDLELQNRCLLMKFIDKLFSQEPVA
jgi:hypothetical protein